MRECPKHENNSSKTDLMKSRTGQSNRSEVLSVDGKPSLDDELEDLYRE